MCSLSTCSVDFSDDLGYACFLNGHTLILTELHGVTMLSKGLFSQFGG